MKLRTFLSLALFIWLFSITVVAEGTPFPLYYNPETEVVVDGQLDDWPNTIPFILASDTQVKEGNREAMEDFFGIIQCFFNDNNLYLAAVINDKTPLFNNFKGNDIYQGDCLEVYLGFHEEQRSTYGTKDYQFGFSLTANDVETWFWTKGRELENYEIKVNNIDKGYIVEARVSLSNFIDRVLSSEEIIWFDFALDNGTGGDARQSQLVWYGDGTGWQTPEVWRKGQLTSNQELFTKAHILTPPGFVTGKSHRVYVWNKGEPWKGNITVGSKEYKTTKDGGLVLNFEREGNYTIAAAIDGLKIEKKINVEKAREIKRITFEVRPIKVNQLGYEVNEEKIFVLTDNEGKLKDKEFQLLSPLFGDVVYEGILEGPVIDFTTDDMLYYGDFSDFKETGKYKISIPGFKDSYVFRIDDQVFEDLFYKTMRSYYLQRCGQKIDDNISKISHQECHLQDAVFRYEPELKKDVTGGWHDAGDYGKYIPPAGVTVAQLSLLYELKGDKLVDFSLDIPESNNGIPDILDELKYELDWMLKMQDDDGGVYHKVNTWNFPGMILPEEDTQTRFLYEKGTSDTAIFTGAVATASRVYQDVNPEYSQKLASAAVKAGEFLLANDVMWPSNDNTGAYRTSSITDELYWAYAELFRLTGRNDFYQETNIFTYIISEIPPFSWDNTTLLAVHALAQAEETPEEVREKTRKLILEEAVDIMTRVNRNGYCAALQDSEYYWASNKVDLAHGLNLILANELYPNKGFIKAARKQLDYVLGVNTLSKSFITDIGTDRVRYPHHRLVVKKEKIVPGLMVGGPNTNAEDGLFPQGLKQKGYVDMTEAYSCNEYAIDYNAPLVFLAGFFLGE